MTDTPATPKCVSGGHDVRGGGLGLPDVARKCVYGHKPIFSFLGRT